MWNPAGLLTGAYLGSYLPTEGGRQRSCRQVGQTVGSSGRLEFSGSHFKGGGTKVIVTGKY